MGDCTLPNETKLKDYPCRPSPEEELEIEKITEEKVMKDQGIYEPLRWMFDDARSNGLWFFCEYQKLWFSPDELEKENRAGRFRWGAVNWVLRNPQERIVELMEEREKIMDEIVSIHQRINLDGEGNG